MQIKKTTHTSKIDTNNHKRNGLFLFYPSDNQDQIPALLQSYLELMRLIHIPPPYPPSESHLSLAKLLKNGLRPTSQGEVKGS